MIRRYERTGQAVRRRRAKLIVKFPDGFPKPLLAAHLAFLVVTGLMLVFGIGPFQIDVAKKGIIGCILGLGAVAVANVVLEHHYMKVGRAKEVKFSTKRDN